jgi:membrane-bound lytic murein transglycosylase MltF
MQMKPSSAREKEIGIDDIVTRAEDNIHAGAKYMRFLADKYIKDPEVDDFNRAPMALAAYNAGLGSLRRFREHAAKSGFNLNIWFGNVEHSAAAIGGQEKVAVRRQRLQILHRILGAAA